MGFMYGNITNHLPRTNFDFYKIYPSRAEMQREVEELAENPEDDVEVPVNAYLLVDYSSSTTNTYEENLQADLNKYASGNFDYTVWQVQLIDELAKAVAIARLHSILPTFEVYGNYKIDILKSMGGPDYFGKGKNIWSINTVSGIPIAPQVENT